MSFCLSVLLLYVPSQQLWSWRDSQFTKPHFFLGKLEQAPLISISKLKMLTLYFNILIETKFELLNNTLNCLLLIIYSIHAKSPSKIKHMHHMTKINKITSAANQNQPVHRMTETSNFISLLSAQLVADNHWFPYMNGEPGTPNR